MAYRQIKREILQRLSGADPDQGIDAVLSLPPRQAVSPLMGLFHHANDTIRWRSIAALGAVVARLADNEMESARVVMRRLIWNLNDESGGIGWGCPEAMAEIMTHQRSLAREFAPILVSYADPRCNFLEYEALQRGLLWGLGRMARVYPDQVAGVKPLLASFLGSGDTAVRGMAIWVADALPQTALKPLLRAQLNDNNEIWLFTDNRLIRKSLHQLALNALSKIDP